MHVTVHFTTTTIPSRTVAHCHPLFFCKLAGYFILPSWRYRVTKAESTFFSSIAVAGASYQNWHDESIYTQYYASMRGLTTTRAEFLGECAWSSFVITLFCLLRLCSVHRCRPSPHFCIMAGTNLSGGRGMCDCILTIHSCLQLRHSAAGLSQFRQRFHYQSVRRVISQFAPVLSVDGRPYLDGSNLSRFEED